MGRCGGWDLVTNILFAVANKISLPQLAVLRVRKTSLRFSTPTRNARRRIACGSRILQILYAFRIFSRKAAQKYTQGLRLPPREQRRLLAPSAVLKRSENTAEGVGVGHAYFSAEKLRDPGSAPSRLRLSSPAPFSQ